MQAQFPILEKQLSEYRAVPWDALPTLGLYMDQVITYVEQQLDGFRLLPMDRVLTPAMVNNYVKMRLIPRPAGKKYGREHLALLMMVCQLKWACPIDKIARLFRGQLERFSVQELYEQFCRLERTSMGQVAQALEKHRESENPIDYTLRIAVEASMLGYAAQSLLAQPDAPAQEVGAGDPPGSAPAISTL